MIQYKVPHLSKNLGLLITSFISISLVALSAKAATVIWDGGGSDNTWNNDQNWSGDTAPTAISPYDDVQISGNVKPNITLNTDAAAQTLTFNSGAAAFTFNGPGKLILTGSEAANYDTGLDLRNNSSATQTFNNDILLSGDNIGVRAQSGDFIFNGNIQIQNVNQLRFLSGAGRTITFNGVISGSVSSTMAFNSGGVINLNNTNTYTNATSIWSATVRVAADSLHNAAGAFGNSTSAISMGTTYDGSALTATLLTSAPVTIGRNITLASTHQNRAGSNHVYTIGSDSTGTITNGTTGGLKNAAKLTVTSVAGGRVNIANIVRNTQGVGDDDDVVKVGLGIVAITGLNNNWEGNTLVQAGTFLVNGTVLANASGKTTQVSTNATLGGIGTLNRDVSLTAGAILAPGDINGVSGNLGGTFTIGGYLTLNNNSILNFDFGSSSSSNNDHVIVQGDLTLGGILNITDLGGFSYGNYKLFDYTGNLNYNEGNVTFGTLPTGYTYNLDTTTFANSVYLMVTPEPGRIALFAGCHVVLDTSQTTISSSFIADSGVNHSQPDTRHKSTW